MERFEAGERVSSEEVRDRLGSVKHIVFNEPAQPATSVEYIRGPGATISAPHTAIHRPSVADDSSDKVLTGPDFFRAMNDQVARKTMEALMGIGWVIEHRAGSADAVAQLLLEVGNRRDLPKVRAAIDFVAEVKTALNERLIQKPPVHLRSVN